MGYREIGETIPRSSASEWVYQVIRKGIVSGEFKGGMQLKQDEISEALNVSHIPVREALRRLESQGLLVIHQNRGAQVRSLTRRNIEDMLEVRASLAVVSLKNSAGLFTPEDLAEMELCIAELRQAPDVQTSTELNERFHTMLGKYADNPCADLFMKLIRDNTDRYLSCHYYSTEEMRNVTADGHQAIVDALRAGDTRKACDLLWDHIVKSLIYIPEENDL